MLVSYRKLTKVVRFPTFCRRLSGISAHDKTFVKNIRIDRYVFVLQPFYRYHSSKATKVVDQNNEVSNAPPPFVAIFKKVS